jgi:hypothetical protein
VPFIDAHAKLAKALASNRDYASAATHAGAARALLDATIIEPTNEGLRAACAEQYAKLGEVHAIVAAESKQRGGTAGEHWRRALAMYERSAAMWTDLRERGVLAESDVPQLELVNREIARCSAAVGP